MITIIIQISLFLIAAILLGYIFGWFTAKNICERECAKKLKEQPKSNGEESLQSVQEVEQDKHETISTLKELINNKDAIIQSLTLQLSEEEKSVVALKKRYEAEIDAFIVERVEIAQNYKALLEKSTLEENTPSKS